MSWLNVVVSQETLLEIWYTKSMMDTKLVRIKDLQNAWSEGKRSITNKTSKQIK